MMAKAAPATFDWTLLKYEALNVVAKGIPL